MVLVSEALASISPAGRIIPRLGDPGLDTATTRYSSARLRPPRPARGVVARARLDGLLELVRTRLLTVVKAPPGFGKTTMAQSWVETLAGQGARVAWLSLTALDDDPERFFGSLAAAVRRACAGEHAPAADPDWMMREMSIPLRHRTEWLLSELAADPGDFFIVLDDYQEITRPEIHQAISAQLRDAPEQLHLIVLGRTDPPIERAALRAHDAVLELGADTLRFNLVETRQLLRKSQTEAAGAHDAALLHAMTGGWVAALRAALLTARIQGSTAQYLRQLPATLRPINALFADLLAQLPAELVDFMQRIAVAERICAPLAETLTGRADAQALLERLEAQQVFISALDEPQQWFAFHRLLRDCLLRHAQQSDPGLEPRMRRRAAAWCAAHGLWAEAIDQALGAGDSAQALQWIEEHAMAAVGAGDLLTLLSWERQLRAHLVESPLRLRLAFAWGLSLAMACDKALVLLDGVEAQLPALAPAERTALAHECLALRSVVVSTLGDYELADALAQRCSDEMQALTPRPWVVNAVRNVLAATCLHTGRWRQLYGTQPLPARQGGSTADRMALVYHLSILGLAELRQGHLDEAAALLDRGMAAGSGSQPLVALPAPTLALARYLQDRCAEAAQLNAEHWDINKRVAPIEALYAAYLVAARLARLEGQPIQARQLLDEGASIGAARGWRRVQLILQLEKVRLCLLEGRLAEAEASAHRIEVLAQGTGRSKLETLDFSRAAATARAWCDLAQGRAADAARALEPLRAAAATEGRVIDRIGLGGSLALARAAAGDRRGAADALLESLQAVHESGALRALTDQPQPLRPLLLSVAGDDAATLGRPWLTALVARVLQACEDGGDAPAAAAGGALDKLSPREGHILRLLAVGQSNKAIARALGITPETVKTHVSRILTKLGAQNRAQAAAMVVSR